MAKRGNGEGSIYRRKDGRWVGSISLENGKRKEIYGKTQKEVQEKLKVALYEQQKGTLATTSTRQTVEQFFTYWLEDVHKPTIRVTSYIRYEHMLRLHFLPLLGRHQLAKLTIQDIQSLYAAKLKEGLSSSTIRVLHAILHKAFDRAVRDGLLPRNLCDYVDLPRQEKYEHHPLSIEQIQQLLTCAKEHHLEALFVLALVTGMRRGELLALKWEDVNFSKGTLYVHRTLVEIRGQGIQESEPKTAQGRRSIYLVPLAIETLRRHRAKQLELRLKHADSWQEHGYVFCTSHGTPFGTTYITKEFKALLQKAKLPNIRFHDLRHSAATLLLSLGVNAKVVQELLGHSKISMTLGVYSHVMPTMQQEAMIKLNDVLQQEL